METQESLVGSQQDLDKIMDAVEVTGEENFMTDFIDEDGGIIDYGDEDVDLDLESDIEEDTVVDDTEYPATPEERISRQEQLRMIHFRAYLNELDEKVKHKKYVADKTREELKKCKERIEQLEEERDQVFKDTQNAEAEQNTAALFRLRSYHERVCEELDTEQDLAVRIKSALVQSEYDLNKANIEKGKFLLEEHDLKKKEEVLEKQKADAAVIRIRKEEKFANKAQETRLSRQRLFREAQAMGQMKQQRAMEDARRAQEETQVYVKQTIAIMKRREQESEERQKSDLLTKMDSVIKLKTDIKANRENLNAIRARDRARERERQLQELAERQTILEQGGNPDQAMLIKKRLEEFENEKRQFKAKTQEKTAGIMNRILVEEERLKKRKKKQPYLWMDVKNMSENNLGPHRKKPLKMFKEAGIIEPSLTEFEPYLIEQEEQEKQKTGRPVEETGKDQVGQGNEDAKESDDEEEENTGSEAEQEVAAPEEEDGSRVNLAVPEFEGLWDQHKPYKVPKEIDGPRKIPGATKMEMDILEKNFEKQKQSIVTRQVAAGREFKGAAFYSKPDVVHFKDFDVGKCYKKRVILTNVSYSVNYCKYIGITEHLKDFIDIHFDPPGQMSAGMTCEMLVTFKPMINEDLMGEVNFMAQTGPFSVPLRCTTKKCDLMVDQDTVDFGTAVIGETLKRTFTLTNKGALATSYEFFKVTGVKQRTVTSAATSLGRLACSPDIQTTSDTVRGESPVSDSLNKTDKPDVTQTQEAPGVDQTLVGEETPAVMTAGDADTAPEIPGEDVEESNDTAREEGSNAYGVSELEDLDTVDGMKVKGQGSGEIGPFSSVRLEVMWQPTIPGKVDCEFLINFADPLSESCSLRALASAIDVPVWVDRQTVDLKICMFDRLYQDTIIVNNRATTALRLKFEVCKELRNHLELLPKTGYIQAQSQFSAQLKFLPRKSLFEDGSKYFDTETGVLEAPMVIRVADQTRPVPFTVQAVITNSDMEFDTTNLDFGCCTIYESVKHTVQLSNKSILPQQYGFLNIPDFVEIQPNDGFGTLLPLETIQLDIIFSPKKAKDYKFDLTCKSLINRNFTISCVGVGVHPPLELSHQTLHFKATSLYDVSMTSLEVVNSHTSTNEFTHPVPRIGKGAIAPVGPTSFEFVVPKGAPITVSPSVGTVEPGKKCHIKVRFSPTLREEDIKREAVRMMVKSLEAKAQRDYKEQLRKHQEAQEQKKKQATKKGAPDKAKGKSSSGLSASESVVMSGPRSVTPPNPDTITKNSAAYTSAVGSLMRQFRGQFNTIVIPCYVASGKCGDPGELPYSIHNTLYLEVHCPIVKPPVVVISDSGCTTTDFGDISVGQHVSKSFTIQNISKKTLELSSSILDTNGPFQMLNALRVLPPDASHTVLISFTPTKAQIYQEVLEIRSPTAHLSVTVMGRGVDPIINLSVDKLLDMGTVLAGEYVEKNFKIHNVSSLSVDYNIKLDSLSLLKHARCQGIPSYLQPDKKAKPRVGVQNFNGQNVFDCVPTEGTIPPGATHEVMVTFAPDHASDHFSDSAKIELFHQEDSYRFQLIGKAKPRVMYLEGLDSRHPDVESLAAEPRGPDEEEDSKPLPTPVLFTLQCRAKEDEFIPASRDLYVGCVRTMAVSQKKSGEFSFDNIQPLIAKGFNIEPQKGLVEAGVHKAVTVTWSPPPGHDPSQPMDGSVIVTLKGDAVEQIKILMKAFVVWD